MDRKSAVLMSMGFELVGIILVAVFVGRWLDQTYGWNQMGLLCGIILGFAGWITHLLIAIREIEKDPDTGADTGSGSDSGSDSGPDSGSK